MRTRVLLIIGLLILGIGIGVAYRNRGDTADARGQGSDRAANQLAKQGAESAPVTGKAAAGGVDAVMEKEFPLVVGLNAPQSDIRRDLDTLQRVFDAWRSNFPRQGNPVGHNAEITAALTGDNRLGLMLIPPRHSAINAEGELCDRWGTPFRFHQLSGEKMEIRSAGPDRKFSTEDDAVWTPQ